jgi:hypothetical protein
MVPWVHLTGEPKWTAPGGETRRPFHLHARRGMVTHLRWFTGGGGDQRVAHDGRWSFLGFGCIRGLLQGMEKAKAASNRCGGPQRRSGSVSLAQEGLQRCVDGSEWWLGFRLDFSWNNGTGVPIYRGLSYSISWRVWTQSVLDFRFDSQLIRLFLLEIIESGKVRPWRRLRVVIGLLCDAMRQAGPGRLCVGRIMRK